VDAYAELLREGQRLQRGNDDWVMAFLNKVYTCPNLNDDQRLVLEELGRGKYSWSKDEKRDYAEKKNGRGVRTLEDALINAFDALKPAKRPEAGAAPSRPKQSRNMPTQEQRERRRVISRKQAYGRFGVLLPHEASHYFRPKELAAAYTMIREMVNKGVCGLHMLAIASFSGCCIRTAQYALERLEGLKLVTVQRERAGSKNLPNQVRPTAKLLKWLRGRPGFSRALWIGVQKIADDLRPRFKDKKEKEDFHINRRERRRFRAIFGIP
jgi:hypothetical protein